jgi:subtilisin family serine protease
MGQGVPPVGYTYGTRYSNEDINELLRSGSELRLDDIGHGTGIAGIAAGSGRSGDVGIAPKAGIIGVRLGGGASRTSTLTTNVMRALKYVIDSAQNFGMPVVVNLSFGTNEGSHENTSLFEQYVDDMSERWETVIVVSAGNEGDVGHHYSGMVNTGQEVDINFGVGVNLETLYITMWHDFADLFEISLVMPSGRIASMSIEYDQFVQKELEGITVYTYLRQPTQNNSSAERLFVLRARSNQIPHGVYKISLRAVDIVNGIFDMWLPTVESVTNATSFLTPTLSNTITLPGTAYKVVTVAGYNAPLGSIASFSGRGYATESNQIKPDMTAPAVGVSMPNIGGGYTVRSGTSFAAPFVTGATALFMQWGIVKGNDPFLYGQRMKAFLHRGAQRNHAISYPNPIWGYGTLCIKNTLDELMNYAGGGIYL